MPIPEASGDLNKESCLNLWPHLSEQLETAFICRQHLDKLYGEAGCDKLGTTSVEHVTHGRMRHMEGCVWSGEVLRKRLGGEPS